MFRSYRGSSRALILGIVRLKAPITRVELASETGLTAAAVSQVVAGLIKEGFIEESQRRVPTRGQPPIELVVRSGAAYMLGVHLEHSLLTALLVDLGGTVLGELEQNHDAPEPHDVLCRAASMCRELLARAELCNENVLGVGLASVGPLELDAGTVNAPPFFPDSWQRVPLRQRLADALGLPVFLDNNATAAATGEYWYGDGRRYPNFLFVHLGVGLGGGLFLGGRVFRGASFNAGEVGHMIVGPERPEPPFRGTRGNLESYASLFALKYDLGKGVYGDPGTRLRRAQPCTAGVARASGSVFRTGRRLGR